MARQIGGLTARVEYAGLVVATAALRALPLERGIAAGAALGRLAMHLDRPNRPVALRNLTIAFPQAAHAERMAILANMYRNWGRMAVEWAHLPSLDKETLARRVIYEGIENWQHGLRLSDGRGGIIVTGHFGNFELMAAAHAAQGNPVAIVHRPLRNPLIDREVTGRRHAQGNVVIPRIGAGRTIVRLLGQNAVIVIPIDLDTRRGVFVDFFSLKTATTDGPARFALTREVPVVPAYIVREGATANHRIVIMPPIKIEGGGDRQAAIIEHTQHCTATLEAMIRRYPDHWNWIHKRWKTRPPGEERFY